MAKKTDKCKVENAANWMLGDASIQVGRNINMDFGGYSLQAEYSHSASVVRISCSHELRAAVEAAVRKKRFGTMVSPSTNIKLDWVPMPNDMWTVAVTIRASNTITAPKFDVDNDIIGMCDDIMADCNDIDALPMI